MLTACYFVALVASGYFVYVDMPRSLGGTTLDGYRALAGDPNLTAGGAIWLVLSLPTFVVQWFRATAAGSWRLDRPGSAWRTIRSSLYVFGVAAVAGLYPWITMSNALAHVMPPDQLIIEWPDARLLATAGLVALVAAISMTVTDAIAGRHPVAADQ